ncbi:glycoside hydrolase family 47 protein, partial [Sphaerobolus stellatus SS14]
TLESMYVMYRVTKDPKWRDRGWQIWEAIAKNTRTWSGFASVYGVDAPHPPREDSMPSYFLAETVKYAYLLTMDEDPWPSDEFVFNTEAHPLPIFRWDASERQRLGVDEVPSTFKL